MPASQRSTVSLLLATLVLLSGWAVAIGLGLRLREVATPHGPTEPRIALPAKVDKIAAAFREFSSHPEVAGAALGFCLLDESGAPIFTSPLAETALCPASSLKTLTTGAALALLGPEFRFETTLAANSAINADGVIDGDLILVGGGDPTLSREDLVELADAVVAGGGKKVSGRLVVDTSVFPEDPVSEHWNWGDIGNAYGAGAFGLNLDHNRLEVGFEPGNAVGAPAKFLGGGPAARETRWENHVITGPAGSGDEVVVYSEPYGRTITLRGTVPAGENKFTVGGAIPDPPALAVEMLRALLESRGVQIADGPGPFSSAAKTTLASHRSAPLPDIIDHLHRVSDNLEAQCLFLTIGRKQNVAPADAVRAFWEKAGVSFVGLRLIDGSGLARANVIRPLDLARVNFTAHHGPQGERFFESLSTYLDGHVRGKIGGMSGVKTQVGFIRTAQGRELTFALMGNGLQPGRDFWRRLEGVLEAVRNAEL